MKSHLELRYGVMENEWIPKYKSTLSAFPTGVCLVVVRHGKEQLGVTISSFTSVSLNPPIVQFSLKNNSRFLGYISNSSEFGVYVLSDKQSQIALHYACNPSSIIQKAILDECTAMLRCGIEEILPKGDHSVVFGSVSDFEYRDRDSLLYYRSEFLLVNNP